MVSGAIDMGSLLTWEEEDVLGLDVPVGYPVTVQVGQATLCTW